MGLTSLLVVCDIAVVLPCIRLWHKHVYLLAHDLGLGIAKHALGCRVEEDETPVLVNGDHRILSRLDQAV